MHTLKMLLVVMLASLLLAACGAGGAGGTGGTGASGGTLDFRTGFGTYRVTAPAGWKVSEPIMDFTSLVTTENDINIVVIMADPLEGFLSTYPNRRDMTAANGKTVTVYDQPEGYSVTSTFNGFTSDTADMVTMAVPIGETLYVLGVSPATTRTLDDATLKQIVDMVATLEVVPPGS